MTDELEEIRRLKAENKRLKETNEILRKASIFSRGNSTPDPADQRFHRSAAPDGHAVESICAILTAEGTPVAARTYRAWKQAHHQPAIRTITDAMVEEAIRSLAYMRKEDGTIKRTAEGLYGRRKMTAAIRRRLPGATPGAVDRAMRSLGLSGAPPG